MSYIYFTSHKEQIKIVPLFSENVCAQYMNCQTRTYIDNKLSEKILKQIIRLKCLDSRL